MVSGGSDSNSHLFLPQSLTTSFQSRLPHNIFLNVWGDGINCWQALSQSDGRWRYSLNNPESSTFAAGNDL